ncbi:hypothetical protein BFP76_04710 [Amylibacter kogurei]|uniref:Methyltransferase FkbM domain-containing protein n=1 Tax=Paramylibacter kogurei TaxID=1889778 RepID=A0A2G5K4N1_9RHOB|nr:FkbM family methyltransferase [Amylibacter kogurei]PIB24507.1 hypothetical protein BFP76_04710 [Amylibacter kogurei]
MTKPTSDDNTPKKPEELVTHLRAQIVQMRETMDKQRSTLDKQRDTLAKQRKNLEDLRKQIKTQADKKSTASEKDIANLHKKLESAETKLATESEKLAKLRKSYNSAMAKQKELRDQSAARLDAVAQQREKNAHLRELSVHQLQSTERKSTSHGMLKGMAMLLAPEDIVFDCGANIGDVTAIFEPTGAQITAFEPDENCVAKMKSRFGDAPNITLIQAGVGISQTRAKLYHSSDYADSEARSQANTLIHGNARVDYDETHASEVEIVNLIEIIEQTIAKHGEIAVLKMDIEGAELDILEALFEKSLFDHIRCSVVETHEHIFTDLADRYAAIRAAIGAKYPPSKVFLDWI